MARQFYPDGSPQHCGIKWMDNDFMVVKDPSEADVPTAACFRIKREAFDKLGGFNERFINGGEDHDLFFRAFELNMTFEFIDTPVVHYSSQSAGRFDYEADNFKLLRELWPLEKLSKLFYEIKKKKKEGAQTKS
jgi:GT2 family glycosyltransferase